MAGMDTATPSARDQFLAELPAPVAAAIRFTHGRMRHVLPWYLAAVLALTTLMPATINTGSGLRASTTVQTVLVGCCALLAALSAIRGVRAVHRLRYPDPASDVDDDPDARYGDLAAPRGDSHTVLIGGVLRWVRSGRVRDTAVCRIRSGVIGAGYGYLACAAMDPFNAVALTAVAVLGTQLAGAIGMANDRGLFGTDEEVAAAATRVPLEQLRADALRHRGSDILWERCHIVPGTLTHEVAVHLLDGHPAMRLPDLVAAARAAADPTC